MATAFRKAILAAMAAMMAAAAFAIPTESAVAQQRRAPRDGSLSTRHHGASVGFRYTWTRNPSVGWGWAPWVLGAVVLDPAGQSNMCYQWRTLYDEYGRAMENNWVYVC